MDTSILNREISKMFTNVYNRNNLMYTNVYAPPFPTELSVEWPKYWENHQKIEFF